MLTPYAGIRLSLPTLVTIDEQLKYVPELAESWEVQENGKVYVFRLRKGVKFHDGTDFDAAAVVWNFERIGVCVRARL